MEEHSPHLGALFYVLAAFALAYFAWNVRVLFTVRVGRPEKDRSLNLLSQITNGLFLGVGQRRVYNKRFPYATVMHFCLGWGFLELLFATTIDFFVTRGWFVAYLPVKDTPWFAALNDFGGLLLFIGLLMAVYRRYANKPEALPQDGFKGRGKSALAISGSVS